ncbi:hypothetical protein QR680_000160 [Steinernema hermaphroditum]|uniref:GTP-binding protein Di-Ras2 n=1 Tax=Steinernema hermaphroditum TaxID=289476 RepID=A0AA39GTL6_9BILA|nr:hypothetical protein QR680_000160 [Steinernema hermaphroditum]
MSAARLFMSVPLGDVRTRSYSGVDEPQAFRLQIWQNRKPCLGVTAQFSLLDLPKLSPFWFFSYSFPLYISATDLVFPASTITVKHTASIEAESSSSGLTAPGGRVTSEQSNDYRVAVFGAGGVGKSSIVLRFVKGTFSENYVPTIEDTYRQVISCNQKNVCTLQITDTTGSHQFPAMQRLSINKGNAFVLIYSVTSKQSLEELRPILLMLKEVKGEALAEVPIMLVGNKRDEDSRREVARDYGELLASKWGTGFIETSAKNNENITELFRDLLSMEKKRQLALSIEEDSTKNNSKKKCTIS